MEALGFLQPSVYVESVPDEITSVKLQRHGTVSTLTAFCGPHEPRGGGGIITGLVRHSSGDPALGADVLIHGQESRVRAGGFLRQDMEARLLVEREDGRYAACGVPRDQWLDVSLE